MFDQNSVPDSVYSSGFCYGFGQAESFALEWWILPSCLFSETPETPEPGYSSLQLFVSHDLQTAHFTQAFLRELNS